MGVDRRSLIAVWHPAMGVGISHFGVDNVLPKQHALGVCATGGMHPGGQLCHRSAVNYLGTVDLLNLVADGRNRAARFTGEEQHLDAEFSRVYPFLAGHFRQP